MKWWDQWFSSRRTLSDIQITVWNIQRKIDKMGVNMADVSQVLNEVAEGLRTNLGPRIAELLSENDTLRARNAELEGEDVAESAAAEGVRSAYAEVVRPFDGTDEAPTPEPLPETPAQSGSDGGPESPVGQG